MLETIQAKILAVSTVFLLVTSCVYAFKETGAITAIIGFIFGILTILVLVLDQNCVVIGGCNIWAWVKFLLTELVILLLIVDFIRTLAKKKPDGKTDK
jgi:hypothetical protein